VRARYIIGLEGGVDPTDRGLAYGDGLFETMLLHGGRVQRLKLHLDRLASGCERLGLPFPERAELERNIAAATGSLERGCLKLILTRGTGPRGYLPPASPDPTVILLAESRTEPPAAELRVTMLNSRLGENELLAGIKHLNRLEQVLARIELSHLDADEGLILSTGGVVIGGTSRNLFAVFGDAIATPKVDRAGIAGVMRQCVLDQCSDWHINVDQRELSPHDLHVADELFMTNALVGIQSVTCLDRTVYSTYKVASRLRQALEPRGNGPDGHG
jgi:4-amino-4-deoxychorismate lyase